MNRRLFARQCAAGLTLSLLPATQSLVLGAPSTNLSRRGATALLPSEQLGTLEHVTIAHVYSPERTSLSALRAVVSADMATVNALLGTDFTLTDQVWREFSSAGYGSFSTQVEHATIMMTWQGLARIGSEAGNLNSRLTVFGSKGLLQGDPSGEGYQLINWQGKSTPFANPVSRIARPMHRRALLLL